MPKGIYQHKPQQGFQKGHKSLFGFQKDHEPYYTGEAKIGHTVSEETRKKIAKKHIGMKASNETIKKLIESHRGQKSWSKNLTKETDDRVLSMSLKLKNKKLSQNHIENLKKSHRTNSYLEKMGGVNNPNYKGGITTENHRIRESIEYKLWRNSNFARDGYICQKCLIKGGKLVTHHIRNFSEIPELRTSIENGITFCRSCHFIFHKKYGRKNNTQEQLNEFLLPSLKIPPLKMPSLKL